MKLCRGLLTLFKVMNHALSFIIFSIGHITLCILRYHVNLSFLTPISCIMNIWEVHEFFTESIEHGIIFCGIFCEMYMKSNFFNFFKVNFYVILVKRVGYIQNRNCIVES